MLLTLTCAQCTLACDNAELVRLDSRGICLVQHPSGSVVDLGVLEAARYRADYSLWHDVQHPYGLSQKS